MIVTVLTIDQQGSRTRDDAIPQLLTDLADVPALRGFERTAGDEVQGVFDESESVLACLDRLLRENQWHIGIGIGPVETPLPTQTRAGRGATFIAAREAVTDAKRALGNLRVVAGVGPGAEVSPADYSPEQVETALILWADLLRRRSAKGWEVADQLARGQSHAAVGAALGITQSAVTQRARTAAITEAERARALAGYLHADLTTRLRRLHS